MNYQPRNNRGFSRYSTPIKVLGSVIVVMIFFAFAAPGLLSGFFSTLFSPLWRLPATFYSAENTTLKQQIEAQSADAAEISALEQENSELKTMLGRTPTKNSILAVVLKKPPFSAYDNLIIDIGTNQGLVVGDMVYAMSAISATTTTDTTVSNVTASSTTFASVTATSSPVIASVKVPIGLVTEADSTTSKVDLFSSPGRKYDVEIGKDHIAVTATGRGAGTFEALLPREANVAVGDVVIIPSIEALVFATVTDIVSDPARPYATVLFQSPVNAFTLHWVEVDAKQSAAKK